MRLQSGRELNQSAENRRRTRSEAVSEKTMWGLSSQPAILCHSRSMEEESAKNGPAQEKETRAK